MNTLIGDIGNTDIKLCLLNSNFKIIKKITFDKNRANSIIFLKKKINSLINKKKTNKVSLFSSVVPTVYKILKQVLIKNFNIKSIELKQLNFNKIIDMRVNKKQVGSDRISNAVGSYHYKSNCIIVDLGTATTFDVIIDGVYKGGVIAPGIKLSLETLTKKAEQIHPISIKKIKNVIGKNTKSALRSGFFWGYAGLINNILHLIKKESRCNFKIILTGGFCYLFKNSLYCKVIIDNDITIKGLVKILKIKRGLLLL